MNGARVVLRLTGFGLATTTLVVLLVLGELLLPFAPRARRHVRSRLFGLWCAAMHPVLGLHVTVEGRVPAPPFLFVSNHLGYLDVVVWGALLRAAFVAKSEVAGWPLVGPIARWVGTIFVDRRVRRDVPRVNTAIDEALDDGLGVVLFPEGTSSAGEVVLPFRSPLLEPAARAGRPVVAGALAYRTPPGAPPARDAVAWWADTTFPAHFLGLLALPRIEARVVLGPPEDADTDRRVLATRLHASVAALHARAGPSPPASVSCPVSPAAPEPPVPVASGDPAPSPHREPACP